MQAKLPDINAAIVTHRNVMLISYSKADFRKCISSLRAIISLLPELYQLEINSTKYHELRDSKKYILCKYCKTDDRHNEIPYNSITFYDKLHDSVNQLILEMPVSKYWICPNCKAEQSLAQSQNTIEKIHDPSYFKIIPEPPLIHDSFDRISYESRFASWFEIAISELEHQIALFRSTYVGNDDKEDDDFDESIILGYDDE